jgi:hypothetical protein
MTLIPPAIGPATRLEKFAFSVQIIYMLRVPILLGAAVFLSPFIADFIAPTLLAGLYDFSEGPLLGAFWYALFVFLFAWVVMLAANLCMFGGPQRMAMPNSAARVWFRKTRRRIEKKNLVFWGVTGLSALAISGIFWVKCGALSAGYRGWLCVGSLTGFALSFALLYLADVLHSLLYKPPGATYTILHIFPWTTNQLKRLRAKPGNSLGFLDGPIEWLRKKEILSRGYFAVSRDPDQIIPPISGYVTMIVLMIVFASIYFIFGFGDFVPISSFSNSASSYQRLLQVPAIVYIPILCTMLCFVLSAASFFLDAYRIPLILPVVIWVFIGSFWQESYYSTTAVIPTADETEQLASPVSPLQAEDKNDYMILVSADGGGIQAAAWTARVLTGIAERCPKCADKIRLISGVSGGSVGTMYYLDALNDQNRGRLSSVELRNIRTQAASSSLRSVAWGLAYPDLLNSFAWLFTSGRGNELEKDWGRNLRVPDDTTAANIQQLEKPLSSWKQGVKEGWRPDVIFNTTMVESGGRVLMTTSDLLNKTGYQSEDKRFTFHDLYPKNDISVASAARMSASFPYVTPVARARFNGGPPAGTPEIILKRYEKAHLADGGYFDNYGTVSLLDWLDARLAQPDAPKKVLIIQIRCGDVTSVKSGEDETLPTVYQLFAPLNTLYNVRTASQRERSDKEIEMVQKLHDGHYKDVEIHSVIFNFSAGVPNPAEPPLSWHLTRSEKKQLCGSWLHINTQKTLEEINTTLTAFGSQDQLTLNKTSQDICEDSKEISALGSY